MKHIFLTFLFFALPSLSVDAFGQEPQDKVYGTNPHNDPRYGTVHTWTDPHTGDRITSVRPGRKPQNSQNNTPNNMPIIVYPEIHRPNPSHTTPTNPKPTSGIFSQANRVV